MAKAPYTEARQRANLSKKLPPKIAQNLSEIEKSFKAWLDRMQEEFYPTAPTFFYPVEYKPAGGKYTGYLNHGDIFVTNKNLGGGVANCGICGVETQLTPLFYHPHANADAVVLYHYSPVLPYGLCDTCIDLAAQNGIPVKDLLEDCPNSTLRVEIVPDEEIPTVEEFAEKIREDMLREFREMTKEQEMTPEEDREEKIKTIKRYVEREVGPGVYSDDIYEKTLDYDIPNPIDFIAKVIRWNPWVLKMDDWTILQDWESYVKHPLYILRIPGFTPPETEDSSGGRIPPLPQG